MEAESDKRAEPISKIEGSREGVGGRTSSFRYWSVNPASAGRRLLTGWAPEGRCGAGPPPAASLTNGKISVYFNVERTLDMDSICTRIREELGKLTRKDLIAVNQKQWAERYGISRERVRQIFAERGIAARPERTRRSLTARFKEVQKKRENATKKHKAFLDYRKKWLNKIAPLWNKRMKGEAIAKALGFSSPGSLYTVVYRLRITFPGCLPLRRQDAHRGLPLTRPELQKISGWLLQGKSVNAISRLLGKSRSWTHLLLLRLHTKNPQSYPLAQRNTLARQQKDVETASRDFWQKTLRKKNHSRAEAEALVTLIKEFEHPTLPQLAQVVGVSTSLLRSRMHQWRRAYPDLVKGLLLPSGRPARKAG